MEWLLILALHLPPEKVEIEDMWFSTYEECMQAAELVLGGKLIPVRRVPDDEQGGGDEPSINAKLIYPVERSEVSCVQAPSSDSNVQ